MGRLGAIGMIALAIATGSALAGAEAATPRAPVIALSFDNGAAGAKTVAGRYGNGIALQRGKRVRLPRARKLASARRMTLELWVRLSRGSGPQPLITVRGAKREHFGLRLSSGRLAGRRLAAGRWKFVATTFNGRRVRTYVGGKLVAQRRVRSRLLPIGDTVQLGGRRFRGAIDNVRVYARALSRAELAADAARDISGGPEGPAGGGPSPALPTTPGGKPGPGPARSDHCMAQPSACGFPDVGTAGVKPGVARETVGHDVTLSTAGQVYENKTVLGTLSVTAPNVIVRNVKVVMSPGGAYGIEAFDWSTNVSNLLLQDVEVDMNGTFGSSGIAYGNFTAQRVFIHNGSDCVSFTHNATVKDSLCVVGPDTNGDAWPDSTSFCNVGDYHFDGLQSDGGGGYLIDHNTIRNPCDQVSAIIMSTNSGPISNVTITNNLMAGGGYTLYCNVSGIDVPNEVVTGNRFAKSFHPKGGEWGPWTGCDDADAVSGNVWDETGAALR